MKKLLILTAALALLLGACAAPIAPSPEETTTEFATTTRTETTAQSEAQPLWREIEVTPQLLAWAQAQLDARYAQRDDELFFPVVHRWADGIHAIALLDEATGEEQVLLEGNCCHDDGRGFPEVQHVLNDRFFVYRFGFMDGSEWGVFDILEMREIPILDVDYYLGEINGTHYWGTRPGHDGPGWVGVVHSVAFSDIDLTRATVIYPSDNLFAGVPYDERPFGWQLLSPQGTLLIIGDWRFEHPNLLEITLP